MHLNQQHEEFMDSRVFLFIKANCNREDVIDVTNYFLIKFERKKIFETFSIAVTEKSETNARIVGAMWQEFEEVLPEILSTGAGRLSHNELRHFVTQSVHRRLGGLNFDRSEQKLFSDVSSIVGVTDDDYDRIVQADLFHDGMNRLRNDFYSCYGDNEVLGFLLGLEIGCRLSVGHLLSVLAFDDTLKNSLSESDFFKQKLSDKHDISSVLSYAFDTAGGWSASFNGLALGFNRALQFWKSFWFVGAILINGGEKDYTENLQ